MGPIYPNQQEPPDGWFWALLLGWTAIACILGLVGWLVVSALGDSPASPEVTPRSDVSPPST